jgi:hypothetical protein
MEIIVDTNLAGFTTWRKSNIGDSLNRAVGRKPVP